MEQQIASNRTTEYFSRLERLTGRELAWLVICATGETSPVDRSLTCSALQPTFPATTTSRLRGLRPLLRRRATTATNEIEQNSTQQRMKSRLTHERADPS